MVSPFVVALRPSWCARVVRDSLPNRYRHCCRLVQHDQNHTTGCIICRHVGGCFAQKHPWAAKNLEPLQGLPTRPTFPVDCRRPWRGFNLSDRPFGNCLRTGRICRPAGAVGTPLTRDPARLCRTRKCNPSTKAGGLLARWRGAAVRRFGTLNAWVRVGRWWPGRRVGDRQASVSQASHHQRMRDLNDQI
jgi:hypothetical protein